MVVSRSKGMTLAIRILSLLVLPVFTLIIIATIDSFLRKFILQGGFEIQLPKE